jgi:hypothetical protein
VFESSPSTVTMEYLPHQDIITFIKGATLSNLDWLSDSIVSFIKLMFGHSTELKSLQELLPLFEKKAFQVVEACNANELVAPITIRVGETLNNVTLNIRNTILC